MAYRILVLDFFGHGVDDDTPSNGPAGIAESTKDIAFWLLKNVPTGKDHVRCP